MHLINLMKNLKLNKQKDAMKIIVCLNWLRPYIPRLSEKIHNLTNLLKKENKTKKISSAQITEIKETIGKIDANLILRRPMLNAVNYIFADASDIGYGSVIIQNQHIVALNSGKFSQPQRNYSVDEHELLALLKCIEAHQKILYGSKIIYHTDHRNLLFNQKVKNSRIERWKIILEEYDITFEYVKGINNGLADFLSREFGYKEEKSEIVMFNEIHNRESTRKIQTPYIKLSKK